VITIGIPTLNGPDRLERCLDSIARSTSMEARFLVCDDGSTEENLKLNKDAIHRYSVRLSGLEMIAHNARLGIARSWNHLVRHYDSDILVIVSDDIEVVPHWLDVLVYSLNANLSLGMVGLNTYTGVTKGQRTGAFGTTPEHVWNPRLDYNEAELRSCDGSLLAIPGTVFAFRRSAFEKAGGFDERFFVFFEDLDFGIRLKEQGLVHAIASYPIVYHMGGATTTDPNNMNAREEFLRSKKKFEEKWREPLHSMRRRLTPAEPPHFKVWNTQLAVWQD
jgi:GT2 family glycosyltransferase